MTIMNSSFVDSPQRQTPGELAFLCNVCGAHNVCNADVIHREGGGCNICGATVRFRSLAAILTERLFGSVTTLVDLEINRDIVGVGMSDAPCYAVPLHSKLSYTNTFYHCAPLLDITRLDEKWVNTCDFIVSSDVFEHVAPPVQLAFDNLYRILKPGGVVVFSVPFSLESDTREHFPNLHAFSIHEEPDGNWLLKNTTKTGQHEEFRDLVFHGGPGTTLEMRLFSLAALLKHFETAGFIDVKVHNDALFEHGIFWLHPWSVTMSARKHA